MVFGAVHLEQACVVMHGECWLENGTGCGAVQEQHSSTTLRSPPLFCNRSASQTLRMSSGTFLCSDLQEASSQVSMARRTSRQCCQTQTEPSLA